MKRGFTLIELLAVIVILAIISLIATPIILNIIDEAKDNASLRSAEFYLDAIEQSILMATLNNRKITDGAYNVLDTGNICLEYEGDKCIDELIIEVKGKKPTGGSITITDGKIIEGSLVIENNLVTIKPNGELVIGDKKQDLTLAPGLYDKNNKLIVSWEELVEKHDFKNKIEAGGYDDETDIGVAALVIGTYEATKLVIDDSVTSIGNYAFEDCSGLISITIGNSVTSIGNYAFYGCSNLTSITIGNSVTSIGNSAFSGCSSLTSITIPDSVTTIGGSAFSGCSSLTSITIGNSITSIGNSAFRECSSLTNITIPDSVTTVGWYAFSGCSSLTNITIPDSVTTIGNYAFSGCSSLINITIPDGVTGIGNYVFEDCSSLINIAIPDSVTTIGEGAFDDCISLTSVVIPDSVTTIGEGAFDDCISLTKITIPSSVTSIGNSAFEDCSGLISIKVDENNSVYDSRNNSNAIIKTATNELIVGCKNTIIPSSVTSIGNSAFEGCSNLTSITIPSSVTSIEDYAFVRCSSLTNITIPSSVTSIGNYVFNYCSNLINIKVDENNNVYDSRNNSNAIIKTATNELIVGCKNTIIPSNVISIGNSAFEGHSNLTSITIPSSVTSIGDYAFAKCGSLATINYTGTEASWNNIFKGNWWNHDTPSNKVINYNYAG